MLKINLSEGSSKNNKPDASEDADFESMVTEPSEKETVKKIKLSPDGAAVPKKTNKVLLAVLVIILIAAAGYYQKDLILKYLPASKKAEVKTPPKTVTAPVAKPEQQQKTEVKTAPDSTSPGIDPAFGFFRKITGSMPEKVWLSSVEINYDGSFTLKAMSFDYKTIADFLKSLGSLAEITAKTIPPVSKSAEAVYNFSVSGKIINSSVPDIIDVVSSDSLAAYSFPFAASSRNTGVKIVRLPKAGAKYGDKDMPFVLDGGLDNVEKVVSEMFSGKRNLRLYKYFVQSLPGMSYDKVRASFSVRSVPAL